MADLATLQLKIDSGDAKKAFTDLDALAAAAERLRKAINNMEQRWRQATKGMSTALATLEASGAFTKLTTGFNSVATAAAATKTSISAMKDDFIAMNLPVTTITDNIGKFQKNLNLGPSNKSLNALAANLTKAATAAQALQTASASGVTTTAATKIAAITAPTLTVQNVVAQTLTVAGGRGLGPPGGGGGGRGGAVPTPGLPPPGGNPSFLRQFTFDPIATSASLATKTLALFQNQVDSLGSSITAFRIIGSFLAAGFIATRVANSALIQTLKEYETKLITLRQVGVDTSASLSEQARQFKALDDAARDTGRNTNFSALEAASGLEGLAKAGLSASEAVSTLPVVLNLSQAQLIAVEEASRIVTSAMRQFGIEAIDASRVADSLSEVANRTSTDVTSLGEALKFVGPIAAQLNKSIEETSAALGVLANAGIQSSLAGTTLRGLFTALTGPTDIAEKAIEGMGLELEQLDPTTNSLVDIIQALGDANLTTAEAVDIFNRRNAATALILVENIASLKELTDQTESSRLKTALFAKEQEQTLAGSFKRLRNAYQELILSNQGLGKAFKDFTNLLAGALFVLAGNTDQLERMDSSAKNLAAGLKVAAYAAGGLLLVLGVAKLVAFAHALSLIKAQALAAQIQLNSFGAAAVAVSRVNPFLLILGTIGTVAAGFAAVSSSAEKYADSLNDIKNAPFNQFVEQLTGSLFELNTGIKEALASDEASKAIDLFTSKLNSLKSFTIELDKQIKLNPEKGAQVLTESLLELLDEALSGVVSKPVQAKIALEIQEQGVEQETEKFIKRLNDTVGKALGKDNDIGKANFKIGEIATETSSAFEQLKNIASPIGITSAALTALQGEFLKLKPEKLDSLSRALGSFLDQGEQFEKFGGDFNKFIRSTLENTISIEDLVNVSPELLTKNVKGALTQAVDAINEQRKEIEESLSGFTLGISTEEFNEKMEDLERNLKNAQNSFDNFRNSLESDINTNFSGFKPEDAKALESLYEGTRLVNEAFTQHENILKLKIQATQEDLRETEELNRTYKDKDDAITALNGKLRNYTEELKSLGAEKQAELEANSLLIQQLRELEQARKKEAELASARSNAEGVLRSELAALLDANREMEKRAALSNATSIAAQQEIEIQSRVNDLLVQFSQEQRLASLSSGQLIDEISKLIPKYVELKTAQEQETTAKQNATRQAKQQFDAIKRLNQDLTAELEGRGKTKVEREVELRIRRVITTEDEVSSVSNKDFIGPTLEGFTKNIEQLDTDSLRSKLEQNVNTILTALDQEDRARQLGKDVANAFSDPLKELFEGGTLKDAAASLAKNLFNIFLNVRIFKPLEEFFEKAFTNKDPLKQLANPNQELISEDAVTKAKEQLAQIQQEIKLGIDSSDIEKSKALALDTDKITQRLFEGLTKLNEDGGKQLNEAFDQAITAAERWELIAKTLLEAFNASARVTEVRDVTLPGSIPGQQTLPPGAFSVPIVGAPSLPPPDPTFEEKIATLGDSELSALMIANNEAMERIYTLLRARLESPDVSESEKTRIVGRGISSEANGPEPSSIKQLDEFLAKNPTKPQDLLSPGDKALNDSVTKIVSLLEQIANPKINDQRIKASEDEKITTLLKEQEQKTVIEKQATEQQIVIEEPKTIQTLTRSFERSTSLLTKIELNTRKDREALAKAPPTIAAQGATADDVRSGLVPSRLGLRSIQRPDRLGTLSTTKVELTDKTIARFDTPFQEALERARIDDPENLGLGVKKSPSFDSGLPIASEGIKLPFGPSGPETSPSLESLEPSNELILSADALDRSALALEQAALKLQQVGGLQSGQVDSNFIGPINQNQSGFSPQPGATDFIGPISQPEASGTSNSTFAGNLFQGLGNQGLGFLNSLFASKFGFSLPFGKGGIFNKLNQYAEGETFGNRSVEKVSDFRNSVVTKPTLAKLAEFGEKGPEAIMPLKSGTNGLGVSAFDNGRESTVVKLIRGGNGKLGIDLSSINMEKKMFASGGAFSSGSQIGLQRFGSGDVFGSTDNRSLVGNGSGTNPTNVNVNVEAPESKSTPTIVNIKSTYNFGSNVKPDDAFRRSARQHEDDLKDRSRRALG